MSAQSPSPQSCLNVERDGLIKRITLQRPEKRNALNLELATQLLLEVQRSERDGTRLIVLRGDGKGFCSGFDLSQFPDCSAGDLLLHFVRIEQMLQAIAHSSVDTLAFLQSGNADVAMIAVAPFRTINGAAGVIRAEFAKEVERGGF